MAPPVVFALPFFQLYSASGLFDTHLAVALAHCLFNIPLAVLILEGFMSGVPRELDETAYVDGYSFWRFFIKIFLPSIAATMTRTTSTAVYELGLLAAAGILTIIPGAFVIYFGRNYIAKGFALGRV